MNNKTDNISDLFVEYQLNLLVLTEKTWHTDSDRAALKRICCMGLNVIEAARKLPHTTGDNGSHCTNHGGLAIVSKPGVNLAKIDTNLKHKMFGQRAPVLLSQW